MQHKVSKKTAPVKADNLTWQQQAAQTVMEIGGDPRAFFDFFNELPYWAAFTPYPEGATKPMPVLCDFTGRIALPWILGGDAGANGMAEGIGHLYNCYGDQFDELLAGIMAAMANEISDTGSDADTLASLRRIIDVLFYLGETFSTQYNSPEECSKRRQREKELAEAQERRKEEKILKDKQDRDERDKQEVDIMMNISKTMREAGREK